MNKNLKTLLSAGVISLAIIGGKTITSDALSFGYTSANLNLRQYASTTSKKITTIPKGSKVTIYKSYGDWYSIRYGKVWGYVNKNYVGNNINNNTNIVVNKGQNKGLMLSRLVIVNTYYNKIYLYQNGKLIWGRSVASGKPSTPSPVGQFTIVNKVNNSNGVLGKAYGTRWMGLSKAHYGIHGTSNPNSISKYASHGCIRLNNTDANYLYNNISVGTRVIISNKTVSNSTIASWYGYKVY